MEAGAEVTAYFFNPNIMPYEEFCLREENLRRLCRVYGADYVVGKYKGEHERFLEAAKGLEGLKEGGERCEKCFYLRLSAVADMAKAGGFDFFCTTLILSPHKNAELINRIGFEVERKVGVAYLPSDFKKRGGYEKSIELSKKYNLYRQNYCGCRF